MATIVGVFHDELAAENVAEQMRLNFDDTNVAVVSDWHELQAEVGSSLPPISSRLVSLGIAEEPALEYSERVQRGEVLVVVKVSDSWLPTAQRILRRAEPLDIDILPEMSA